MFSDLFRARGAASRRPAARPLSLLCLEDRTVPAIIGFAAGAETVPTVNVYDTTGNLIITFNAYPGFGGGVHVAVGDVTGDGVPDVVTGAGAGGGAHVKIFDGA